MRTMALSLSQLSEPCIEPMDGEIKHSWIVIKRPLRALTVVDVPVHYQDLLYTSKIEERINILGFLERNPDLKDIPLFQN